MYALVWDVNSFLIKFHKIWTHRLLWRSWLTLSRAVAAIAGVAPPPPADRHVLFYILSRILVVVFVAGCVNYRRSVGWIHCLWPQSENRIYKKQLLMDIQYIIMIFIFVMELLRLICVANAKEAKYFEMFE